VVAVVVWFPGAWSLLSQLWEEQMKRSPNDHRIMENIGNICLKNGAHLIVTIAVSLMLRPLLLLCDCVPAEMYMMAVRQFQQAASKAFEQGQYIAALKVSVKAEKALKKLYKQQFGDEHLQSKKQEGGQRELSTSDGGLDMASLLGSGEVGLKPDVTDWLMARSSGQDLTPNLEGMTWQQFRYARYRSVRSLM
jgi:hypothetical protein